MPFGYVIWAFLSIIAAFVTMIPTVVVIASLYSFGLAAPLFILGANLWWVVLLLGPVVWFQRRGKMAMGIAASIALAAVVTGGFYALRALALDGIAAPQILTVPGALVGRTALSVEIRDDRNRSTPDVPCNVLCEGLLMSGASWVRVASWGADEGQPEFHVFRRAEAAECLALDPTFPAGAMCILLGKDDGRVADLSVHLEKTGDGYVARKDLRGLAFVSSSQRLMVTDQRDGTVLHDQTTRFWMQATGPVPLWPNSGFDGNGLHGGGLTFSWSRLSDPVPEVAQVLQALGQPVSSLRAWIETRPARRPGFSAEGYWANLPQDRALMLSIMKEGGETLPRGLVQQVQRWMQGLLKEPPIDADRAVLKHLPARLPSYAMGLNALMSQWPEMFVDDYREFYRMVREGNEEESRSAAATLRGRVLQDPFGSHDAEAPEFLAALESGRQWDSLIQLAGRYGFDPTPVLRREIDSPRDAKDGPDVHLLLLAACRSDPKWAATLGPLVHDMVLPLARNPMGQSDHRRKLALATNALMRMGRRDLALDLRNQPDWDVLPAEFETEFSSSRPRMSVQAIQEFLYGRLEASEACD